MDALARNLVYEHFQPFMKRQKEQVHITENTVSSPPALVLTDERGDRWCLGTIGAVIVGGEFAYPVVWNGRYTGEVACRIEMTGGRIKIFTAEGFKRWTGRAFV